jgi:hypothetical protein
VERQLHGAESRRFHHLEPTPRHAIVIPPDGAVLEGLRHELAAGDHQVAIPLHRFPLHDLLPVPKDAIVDPDLVGQSLAAVDQLHFKGCPRWDFLRRLQKREIVGTRPVGGP